MHPDPAQRTASAGALADAFGAAIGSTSRRTEIAQAPRHRPRRITSSNQGLLINKAETLALDLSAAPSIDERYTPPPPIRETPPPDPRAPAPYFADDQVDFARRDPDPLPASLPPSPRVDRWADPVDERITADPLGSAPAPRKMGRATSLVVVVLVVLVVLGACAAGGLVLRALVSGGLSLGF